MVVIIVEAGIVLAFEGFVFGRFESSVYNRTHSPETKAIPTYLSLFIFSHIFQIILAWDSLRLKNTIQTIGLCLFNGALLIYAVIQIFQIRTAIRILGARIGTATGLFEDVHPFLIAIPCVIALGTVLLAVITGALYREFGWSVYKHIGADVRMKRRYLLFQIFVALLKFDFVFFVAFTIQFIVIILNTKDPEFGLTIAVIPATILILLFTGWSVRQETVLGMIASIVFFMAGLAYFLFKLVRMYEPSQSFKYEGARTTLTVFAVITVILLVVTIVMAIVCTMNFGKGLREHVRKRKVATTDDVKLDIQNDVNPAHINPDMLRPQYRMTID